MFRTCARRLDPESPQATVELYDPKLGRDGKAALVTEVRGMPAPAIFALSTLILRPDPEARERWRQGE
jgi:hypothetical protein